MFSVVSAAPGGSADTNWFATAIGDLTLITLDTEVSMAGAQRDWLEGALQRGRDAKWLVASYHRPAYPAVKSASGAREHWVPLFERYDVDLVCESDGHSLKRTVPIREDRVDYTGVTYVGEGGLGVPQRTPDPDRWYLQEPGMVTSAHHVQVLSFEPELLRYRVVLHEGTVLDELTIATHEARHAGRIAPTMAEAVTKDRVEVTFTEALAAESAADPAAWTIEPPLEVTKVEVSGASGNIATLHVSDLDPETVYRLSVTGVTDEASTAVVPGATVSFVHGGVDLRASAINTDAGLDHGESGGCSTTSGGSQTSLALAIWLFALGLWRARVVRVW